MQAHKELAKELAEFCREFAHQERKTGIHHGIGKVVLQGVMDALLAVSASSFSGAQTRSGPWQIGN